MIEKHVTSLEISKQLKEAGFPQETEFYWLVCNDGKYDVMKEWEGSFCVWDYKKNGEIYAAPLSSEIGERLPSEILHKGYFKSFVQKFEHPSTRHVSIYYKSKGNDDYILILADTESNARAKMWIYLKQNGLLEE